MIFRDISGQVLADRDQVLFSLGLGQTTVATISRTESGLDPRNPNASISIVLELTLPAAPNGLVPGVCKITTAPQVSS